ncbi:oligosaccharide flippase family protein [Pontibacter sp. E15-1]|uniref:lipopolysaccharide biosynthesis protein n=1 Tax=Pontibacter sp. E15-1 TaxID=2919918 RepID=UPI001F503E6E|nr:oligosaccharide flippase family protein [Pontibacter sp. E15-1]MCJ8164006.1 oligosaccharide flippase family protein [Pontibacter sp. E15-1]
MLRKVLSHAAIYGLAAQVPRLAGILTLPVITRYLTTMDYGVAGVISAYVSALGILQSLGLSVVMVSSFARYPTRYRWVWRQLHGFILLWSLVYGVLLGVILYWAIPGEAAENRWLLVALNVLPAILFNSMGLLGGLFYQLQQRPLPIAVNSFVVGFLTVGLNIYLIAYLRLGYMGWFYSNFAGGALSFLVLGYMMYLRERMWPIFRFSWRRIRQSLRVSLPVVPHYFSFFLLDTSDRLVMDFLRVPLPRIGSYNIASSFGLYFSAASGAVVQAATPVFMGLYAKAASSDAATQARQLTFSLQVLYLVGTSLLGLWMKEIFVLLIRNETLQAAYPLAIIILMGYNYKPMYLAVTNQLVYQERTSVLWKISTVAGVGNVILNLLLVPVFGIEAAAFTTFAALMFMGYAGYLLKEYRQVSQVDYLPWLWLPLTVLALLAVYLLADVGVAWKIMLTSVLVVAGTSYLYLKKQLH